MRYILITREAIMNNNLVVCNCANCESCNSDDFDFYCKVANQIRRRIDRGCDLFKCKNECGKSTSTIYSTLKKC